MLQKQSRIDICDKSGGLVLRIFQVYKKSRNIAKVGSNVRGSLQSVVMKSKRITSKLQKRGGLFIKKGTKFYARIAGTRYPIVYIDGSVLRFSKNFCVLFYRLGGSPVNSKGYYNFFTTRRAGGLKFTSRFKLCI